ncbi:MAG: UDP-N-acetylmuramate dehydrogenase [Rhodothalassiaceae bacterium]
MTELPSWYPKGLRGRLLGKASLRRLTWFRAGGPADWLFEPADREDLALFMAALPQEMPITVLGTGSNILIRDGGVDGVVVHLGKTFQTIEIDGERVRAGGGTSDVALAQAAAQASLTGLEFLRGVPGTVGGAVAMNAGAYGQEVADVFISAELLLRDGEIVERPRHAFEFGYRRAVLPPDAIILSALFQCRPHDAETIMKQMERVLLEREESQPLRTRTGGSTFKNPPGAKAWELIDRAGCRGLRIGTAQVSEKHCNFLIADPEARAADIEALGEEVRARVRQSSGIDLEWEIRRIGREALP